MCPQLKQVALPVFNSLATTYRSVVGAKLAKYGLRFDDLQDPLKDEVSGTMSPRQFPVGPLPRSHYMQDVAEALRRLPPDVVVARNCRLRRALDLSCKHEALPKDLLEKQTPELSYLQVSSYCV